MTQKKEGCKDGGTRGHGREGREGLRGQDPGDARAIDLGLWPGSLNEAARDRAIAGYRAVGFLDTFVRAYEERWPGMIESYRDVVKPGLERRWRERWTSKMFGRAL